MSVPQTVQAKCERRDTVRRKLHELPHLLPATVRCFDESLRRVLIARCVYRKCLLTVLGNPMRMHGQQTRNFEDPKRELAHAPRVALSFDHSVRLTPSHLSHLHRNDHDAATDLLVPIPDKLPPYTSPLLQPGAGVVRPDMIFETQTLRGTAPGIAVGLVATHAAVPDQGLVDILDPRTPAPFMDWKRSPPFGPLRDRRQTILQELQRWSRVQLELSSHQMDLFFDRPQPLVGGWIRELALDQVAGEIPLLIQELLDVPTDAALHQDATLRVTAAGKAGDEFLGQFA